MKMGETKGNFKEGKACGFRPQNYCTEGCGLYCVGLKGCVLHSMNMHLKEIADNVDKVCLKLHFIEKKLEK